MIVDPRIQKHGLGLATFTAEIDLATGRCLGPAKWNRLSDFGMGIAEGPHIFKKDGYYYLSTAEGGTDEGHQQWICRSTKGPFGPWEVGPKGTVLLTRSFSMITTLQSVTRATWTLLRLQMGNGLPFSWESGLKAKSPNWSHNLVAKHS